MIILSLLLFPCSSAHSICVIAKASDNTHFVSFSSYWDMLEEDYHCPIKKKKKKRIGNRGSGESVSDDIASTKSLLSAVKHQCLSLLFFCSNCVPWWLQLSLRGEPWPAESLHLSAWSWWSHWCHSSLWSELVSRHTDFDFRPLHSIIFFKHVFMYSEGICDNKRYALYLGCPNIKI